ncbi:NACHT, LRR and PYD domains-containing protein 1a-like isoform X2 [Protopterus annectens]|uniref:NACHT, LRR and PYD domains-containing protein 1a-like isoform X2 n=1 Tax=Protopterus annectens TaxID=7888 RepID=UPI001CF9B4A0|nr:NACHT, LRR and PYD domains-containing protein 1a-like isoform X2 [Protopterus annectens]
MVTALANGGQMVHINGREEEDSSFEEKEGSTLNGCIEENESSGDESPESSSESDSEDTEENEERGDEKEKNDQDDKSLIASAETSEFYIRPSCEHCKITNKNDTEKVTPRKISKGQFLLMVDEEGSYHCLATGLIFEVSGKVEIKYSILSWSKYGEFIKPPWILGGPIFNVSSDVSKLKSVHFPHSLCLGDHDSDVKFGVLHMRENVPQVEPSVDHSATHIKWNVSSLSPVGPLIQTSEAVQHHGAVLLYKVIDDPHSFRVYVAANSASVIKDISNSIKHSQRKFMKIDKPPVCQKLLQEGKKYRLKSECESTVDIIPQEIEFHDDSSRKLKNFIEVYLEHPVNAFKLSLEEVDSDQIIWTAALRECDWLHSDSNGETSQAEPIKKRKRKSTASDEEGIFKQSKWGDITDEPKKNKNLLITDQQLLVIAKKLGKEWKEIGICCLSLEMKDIDQIQDQFKDEGINIHKFRMLAKWREREKDNGTVQRLYDLLKPQVTYEVQETLEEILSE